MKEPTSDNPDENTDKNTDKNTDDSVSRLDSFSLASKVWATLHHGELSPRIFNHLLANYGTLDAILSAEVLDHQERFEFDADSAQTLAGAAEFLGQAESFIKTLTSKKINSLTLFDSAYPAGFRELNDPPPIVFYRGDLNDSAVKTVALVGSASATQEGISVAVDFGARVADANVTLVSGLTRGIDTGALIGAITAGGKTRAVTLAGLENLYPADCEPVFEQVIQSGCVFSEYSPELEFETSHTSEANRLITALAQAVVIGEVTDDSLGTLDIAQSCVESGKLLFVLVPTEVPIHDEKALEPFVELGAAPVRFPEDIDTILRCLV